VNRIKRGVLAGAAGTLALEIVTYGDMTSRGRPSSDLPARAAGELAKMVGSDLGDGEQATNRQTGIGSLLGYGAGIGLGTAVGIVAGRRRLPRLKGPVLLGALAMIAGDMPMVALGVTNPRTWTKKEWLTDAVPHAAYGLATALVWNSLAKAENKTHASRAKRWRKRSRTVIDAAGAVAA
jgi:hypothetical protein